LFVIVLEILGFGLNKRNTAATIRREPMITSKICLGIYYVERAPKTAPGRAAAGKMSPVL
jgi:hypothetical protein